VPAWSVNTVRSNASRCPEEHCFFEGSQALPAYPYGKSSV